MLVDTTARRVLGWHFRSIPRISRLSQKTWRFSLSCLKGFSRRHIQLLASIAYFWQQQWQDLPLNSQSNKLASHLFRWDERSSSSQSLICGNIVSMSGHTLRSAPSVSIAMQAAWNQLLKYHLYIVFPNPRRSSKAMQ